MSLTILNVAYPLAPVGPDAAGGAEQVLSALDAALVERGHRSIVLACEGSGAAGELWKTPIGTGRPLLNDLLYEAEKHVRCALAEILRRRDVDLVHMHASISILIFPKRKFPCWRRFTSRRTGILRKRFFRAARRPI